MSRFHFYMLASLGLAIGSVAVAQAATNLRSHCEQLTQRLPAGLAQAIAVHVAAGESQPALLPFCRITGTVATSTSSTIRVEVWLPTEERWNGNFLARGYSFYGGSMDRKVLAEALHAGYATATTDGGGGGERGARFLYRQPQKLIDVGERAWHETVRVSKALAQSFYGRAPRLSYFKGCGGEGRQGLKAAQRYPQDFDAIAVGGIAHDTPRFAFAQMHVWEVAHRSKAAYLPASKLPALHRAAIQQCDDIDGAKDGLIQDPRRCSFDPKSIQCASDDQPECLTAAQVETARAVYAPVVNPRTKRRISGPLMPGSELGWASAVSADRPSGYALDFFRFLVFENPDWDYSVQPLDYDRDVERARKVDATFTAVDADLSAFVNRGGKLLLFGGWSDTAIPPTANTDYYESVVARMGVDRVRDAVRLFMVPGMGHCPGPGFGGVEPYEFDPLAILVDWKERGRAPGQIVATRMIEGREKQQVLACPYPHIAVEGTCRD